MKKFPVISALALCLLILGGCGNDKPSGEQPANTQTVNQESDDKTNEPVVQNDVQEEEETEEVSADLKDLSNWAGTWGSMTTYLDDPKIDEAMGKLAEKNGTTAEEEREAYDKKRAVEFEGIKFEGDTVTFFDHPEKDGGTEIAKNAYKFDKVIEAEQTWYVYKSEDADAKYPVLFLMETDNDSGLHHFHMRYGQDEAEVLAMDKWYPGFVDPDTTTENIVHDILD